jgi:hypothetical protein
MRSCITASSHRNFAEPKGSLYTREAFRCGGLRADEGIGPYGLQNIGWDAYRTIDIRYKDQVVCKK